MRESPKILLVVSQRQQLSEQWKMGWLRPPITYIEDRKGVWDKSLEHRGRGKEKNFNKSTSV